MAVPLEIPEAALHLAYLSCDAKHKNALGDLIIIAFFFLLLRSGEYTKPRKVKRNGKMVTATRTEQFLVKDIGFWKDGKILPRRSSLEDLLTATAVTMKISNQKNGRTGQTLHHESTGLKGAVAALAEDNLLCDVYTAGAVWTSVEGFDIVRAV